MAAVVDSSAPGFRRMELKPEGAERLVLRFTQADIAMMPSDAEDLGVEMVLQGSSGALESWNPSIRRIESLLVLGEETGPVQVKEVRIKVPASIRDVEAHSESGDIESAGLALCFMVSVGSGRIDIKGASTVSASTEGGLIEVSGAGSSELKSVSGKIRCLEPREKLLIKSDSGDVEVDDSTADLFLETKSGDIVVSKPKGRIRILSDSGDIDLDSPEGFNGGEANTQSGRISLELEGASVELRAETLSGRLRAPEGEVQNTTGPRRFAATRGHGGRRLHLKSVSGDIEIEY